MKTLTIQGQTGESRIVVGERLANLSHYAKSDSCVLITDVNVHHHYRRYFNDAPVIVIGTGESVKAIKTVQDIYEKFIEYEVDRTWTVVGVGGGIVTDIAGFVASTYLRGLRFGFVSSTLLAQVDASVGGKNGVNFHGYKNMVGVFNQPEFVLCDLEMLNTLPEREVHCGYAEVVKYALIGDPSLFEFLENNYTPALALDRGTLERIVYDCVSEKANVVQRDEREKGERRVLNFGHTFGHAYEKTISIPHGEAVSLGMVIATELSARKGALSKTVVNRVRKLLEHFELPTTAVCDKTKIFEAITKDKKREGYAVHFVLLNDIGRPVIEPVSFGELKGVINDLC